MADVDAVQPILALEHGHVAEARRALHAQGRRLDDSALERLLWTARALPIALDLLAETTSPIAIADACFTGATVEVGEATPLGAGPVLALARRVDGGIEVDMVECFPYLDNDDARLRCRVTLSVSPHAPGDGVRLVRFHLR
ncbi:MAG: hypothetical protein IT383_21880 [Deltaproteobacteria bacterium]|nr:hypothetical protein [Deltaproteobacteria bacterium]